MGMWASVESPAETRRRAPADAAATGSRAQRGEEDEPAVDGGAPPQSDEPMLPTSEAPAQACGPNGGGLQRGGVASGDSTVAQGISVGRQGVAAVAAGAQGEASEAGLAAGQVACDPASLDQHIHQVEALAADTNMTDPAVLEQLYQQYSGILEYWIEEVKKLEETHPLAATLQAKVNILWSQLGQLKERCDQIAVAAQAPPPGMDLSQQINATAANPGMASLIQRRILGQQAGPGGTARSSILAQVQARMQQGQQHQGQQPTPRGWLAS